MHIVKNYKVPLFRKMIYTADMEQISLNVSAEDNRKRLDKFLVEQFSSYSRSFLQSQIKKGKITLNGSRVITGNKLKEGDEVKIILHDPKIISLKPNKDITIDVIFENDDLVVINKPSGIVVHPSQSTPEHTLVNGLISYYPNIISIGDDPNRPGIVHRLDKDASGIMVIAKSQKTFEHLKTQFQDREIKKKYTALVFGKITPSYGKIDAPIGRSKSKPSRMSVKRSDEGKEALTYYKTTKEYNNYSLLEIETKTGRTHQIRVHLLSIGYPIVGDSIYYVKKTRRKVKINRIFLHAQSIQFSDINGSLMKFKANLPNELKQFLKQLT
jgi:23S rRNA pseudouridine1911/1915/1917 synthase